MITWNRTASYTPATFGATMTFAQQITVYVKELLGIDVRVTLPVGGDPSRIRWTVEYASLGALEEAMRKALGDPQYVQMVAEASDYFIDGSIVDEIWASP